jgi:hypothetical protein
MLGPLGGADDAGAPAMAARRMPPARARSADVEAQRNNIAHVQNGIEDAALTLPTLIT